MLTDTRALTYVLHTCTYVYTYTCMDYAYLWWIKWQSMQWVWGTNYTFVHVVCLPAHALPLCTSSQVAHRGWLHWMQADTFIVSYSLLQKLESLSLIDEAWLVSGTLPANTHKNRSKDVLPCECTCHLVHHPHPFLSTPVLWLYACSTLPALVWLTAFLTHFPIVTSNLIHSSTSPPFFLR